MWRIASHADLSIEGSVQWSGASASSSSSMRSVNSSSSLSSRLSVSLLDGKREYEELGMRS